MSVNFQKHSNANYAINFRGNISTPPPPGGKNQLPISILRKLITALTNVPHDEI